MKKDKTTPPAVSVKNDSEKPIPTEVIADSIVAISEGIKKLRSGRLNDKALLLLIQHASPQLLAPYRKVGITEIKAVIEGMESLESTFLKKR